MAPTPSTFLRFLHTGALMVIHPDMALATLQSRLPGCDHRPNPPYDSLIGTHIEITFEHQQMIHVRVRFIPYATEPWTMEVAPWFDWLQHTDMNTMEQLLQEQQLEYRCLSFKDGSYAIELSQPSIRLAYDTPQQIFALFRLYQYSSPWQHYTVTKTFPDTTNEEGAM